MAAVEKKDGSTVKVSVDPTDRGRQQGRHQIFMVRLSVPSINCLNEALRARGIDVRDYKFEHWSNGEHISVVVDEDLEHVLRARGRAEFAEIACVPKDAESGSAQKNAGEQGVAAEQKRVVALDALNDTVRERILFQSIENQDYAVAKAMHEVWLLSHNPNDACRTDHRVDNANKTNGWSLLNYCAQSGFIDVKMDNSPASLRRLEDSDNKALQFVDLLLSKGAEPMQRDAHGALPFYMFCRFGKLKCAKRIYEYQQKLPEGMQRLSEMLNARCGDDGLTPLTISIMRKKQLVSRWLISIPEVDLNLFTDRGHTALDLARETRDEELAALIKSKGGKDGQQDAGSAEVSNRASLIALLNFISSLPDN